MSTTRCAAIALMLSTLSTQAQEAVDLDALQAPTPRRAGDGIRLGDLKFNLLFDAMVIWNKSAGDDDTAGFKFAQKHQSLLARATTPDEIEVLADILHPGEVFEATIPYRFFVPSVADVPFLGKGGVRGGLIVVPFGDFEEHPIYGGAVNNSMAMRDVAWSDYGLAFSFPWKSTKTELYVVNGLRVPDSISGFGSDHGEQNQLKGFGMRTRVDPVSGVFATGSIYYDFLPRADTVRFAMSDRVALAGLDLGFKRGAFSSRLGGAYGWTGYRLATDSTPLASNFTKRGWYAEGKWTFSESWALRLRGGQVDPDSRYVNDDDLTNVNVSGIWTKGPVDCRLTYFRNWETHWPGSTGRPGNLHRILLETLISI